MAGVPRDLLMLDTVLLSSKASVHKPKSKLKFLHSHRRALVTMVSGPHVP